MLEINTSRFGKIELDETALLLFPDGIFGFDDLKLWTLVDTKDNTFIQWLQSTTNEYVALPLLKADILDMHYPQKIEEIGYLVLTIPQNITNMTANLKAPIFINSVTSTGIQKLQPNRELPVLHKMYMDLKRYITSEV